MKGDVAGGPEITLSAHRTSLLQGMGSTFDAVIGSLQVNMPSARDSRESTRSAEAGYCSDQYASGGGRALRPVSAALRRRRRAGEELLDVELADLPPAARWREWMLRVEAAMFASARPA